LIRVGHVLGSVAVALGVALLLALYVVALYLFRGAEPFAALGTTLTAVVLSYFVGAVLAGTVVGLLLPLVRWPWGAALVGFAAAMPVYAVMRVLDQGFVPWTTTDTTVSLVFALLLGAPVGVIYRRLFRFS
jgi:hypothetical protein